MEINKNIMKAVGITAAYIIHKEDTHFCTILEVNDAKKDEWKIAADSDELNGPGTLKIKFKEEFVYLKVEIGYALDDDIYSFTYMMKVIVNENDELEMKLMKALKELEEKNTEWNRRKEERYDIGIDEKSCELMKFKRMEQIIISNKKQLPCVINNISISGAKITTVEGNFKKDAKICLLLSYKEPIEQIPLIGIIRNCVIKKITNLGRDMIISVISIEYIETPIEYKERLMKYITNIKKEKKDEISSVCI